MKAKDFAKQQRPENKIQVAIEEMLRNKGWYVLRTHGGMYQAGFPDDYATHPNLGQRWVEIKLPGMVGSRFTKAQLLVFPKLVEFGAGVWILTAATEREYRKLFTYPKGNFNEVYLHKVMGVKPK